MLKALYPEINNEKNYFNKIDLLVIGNNCIRSIDYEKSVRVF